MTNPRAPVRFWLACGALYAALLVLYWPSLRYGPISLDDLGQLQVAARQSLAQVFTADRYGHVRPAKSALFWVLSRSPGQPEPWLAFRACALLALLLATALVQRFATRLTRSRVTGLTVAACWALNPTTATVTCWLSAANIALCLIGVLLYLECAARGWLVAALLSLVLALSSHELGAVAPLLLWAQQALRGPDEGPRVARGVYGGSAVAVLLYLALALGVGRVQADYRFASEPAWLICASAARYLTQNALFWLQPRGRFGVLLGDRPAQHLLASGAAWVALIAVLLLLWKQRRRDPVLAFGLAWCVVTLAPVANFVPLGNTPLAMHYAYLPGVGLALALVRALAALVQRIARGHVTALRVLTAAVLLGFALSWLPETARAVRAWGDEEQLFAVTVQNHPDEVEPLVNLASVYLRRQRYDRAAAVLDRAKAIAPDDLGVVRNRFSLAWQTGHIAAALDAIDRHPAAAQRPEFQLGRGQALARLGRPAEAAIALRRAFDSASPEIDRDLRFTAGLQLLVALLQTERRDEAERVYDRLLAAYPERADAELSAARQLLRSQP